MPSRHPVLAALALALGLAVALAAPVATDGPAPAVVGPGPARQSGEDLQPPEDPGRDPERTRERAD